MQRQNSAMKLDSLVASGVYVKVAGEFRVLTVREQTMDFHIFESLQMCFSVQFSCDPTAQLKVSLKM